MRQLVAQELDHLPPDTMLAQLRLHQPPPAGRMPVALLQPPASEGQVVEETKLGEMIERPLDDRISCAGASQPPFDLPATAWPRTEKSRRDLDSFLGARRLGLV